MPSDPFIAIGTRGTTLTDLTELPSPFREGVNELPRPASKTNPDYLRAHAWITNKDKGTQFTLARLSDAVAHGLVTRVSPIRWRWTQSGKLDEGEAFFPADWKQRDPQPEYVAVRTPNGAGKTVENGPKKTPSVRGIFLFSEPNDVRLSKAKFLQASARQTWTRDELLIALNVYHKLTFGQFHARNPVIISLAGRLGRGANSVAMKLCNFASLDPALKLRGIKGLDGASKLDSEMWNEFHANLNEAAPASENALRALFGAEENSELEVSPKEGVHVHKQPPSGSTEAMATAKQRRGQEYFRTAVINNFNGRCGITGLAVRDLLIASHILPWGTHVAERLNVRNGLCLSRLHDAAFDRGLIAFDDKFRLLLSPHLKAELAQRAVAENFGAYANEALHVPKDAALPELAFLATHRAKIFRKQ